MFYSKQKFTVDTPILKYVYIRYTQPSLNLVNAESNQFFLIYPAKIVLFH